MTYKLKSGLIYILCLSIFSSGFLVPIARAEGEGSLVIETLDPATGKPIPSSLLKPGMKVKLAVHAFDAAGNAVSCTPKFEPQQGVSGQQIQSIDDASGVMEMGSGFGTAEVKAHCAEFPEIKSKMMVTNNTLKSIRPSVFDAQPEAAPAAAPAANGGAVLLGIVGAAAVVGLVVLAMKPKFPCATGQRYCKDDDSCCPGDKTMLCETPASVRGCYTDTFAVPYPTCTRKVFCSLEGE
ncbi:MAG: hypothetical protein AABZ55_12385 [Bdellovibrionota bacterium]